MSFDIRDISTVEHTLANLQDLILACRQRGPFYGHDMRLANDVLRKAKGLQTALTKLQAALDDPHHQAMREEQTQHDQPLLLRLYYRAYMHELAKFISYGGKRDKDARAKCEEMRLRFGDEKVNAALVELTRHDGETGLIVLKPEVRKLCRQLLGPAPEDSDYQRYWEGNRRTPPADHLPPGPEEEGKSPEKKSRRR